MWRWGDSFWTDGYFAETVGRASEEDMKTYIRMQWAQEQGTSPGL
ncbi:hypothetical protein GX553_02425 [Candidatus Peribacteria bacterium]|jgi:REP element-mobilizing transposase RayT|nr:hypothetical protein [Candidatus Peribacteria bacterium]